MCMLLFFKFISLYYFNTPPSPPQSITDIERLLAIKPVGIEVVRLPSVDVLTSFFVCQQVDSITSPLRTIIRQRALLWQVARLSMSRKFKVRGMGFFFKKNTFLHTIVQDTKLTPASLVKLMVWQRTMFDETLITPVLEALIKNPLPVWAKQCRRELKTLTKLYLVEGSSASEKRMSYRIFQGKLHI